MPPPPPDPEEIEEPQITVADRLSQLRQELHALSATLIDDLGKPLVQAGDFPDTSLQESLTPALMGVFSASTKVSTLLDIGTPLDLFNFSGKHFDLFMTHVGQAYALVVTTDKNQEASRVERACPAIKQAVGDLQEILAEMGVPVHAEEEPPAPLPEPAEIIEEEIPADFEELFRQAATADISAEEINAFWETPAESIDTGSLNADDLTYDQAHKLGFTPSED